METLSYNYFAYGSNMNFLQMEQRCPGARFQGRGIYLTTDFIFTAGGMHP